MINIDHKGPLMSRYEIMCFDRMDATAVFDQ